MARRFCVTDMDGNGYRVWLRLPDGEPAAWLAVNRIRGWNEAEVNQYLTTQLEAFGEIRVARHRDFYGGPAPFSAEMFPDCETMVRVRGDGTLEAHLRRAHGGGEP